MSDSLLTAFGRVIWALSPIFLAILSWLAIRVAALINARVKAEKVRSALHRLDDAVFRVLSNILRRRSSAGQCRRFSRLTV